MMEGKRLQDDRVTILKMLNRRLASRSAVSSTLLILCLVITITTITTHATETTSQNSTKLQARISLESKNLDLAEAINNNEDSLMNELISNEQQNSNSTEEKKRANRLRSNKSSRRLSNIWSMLLPGSSGGESDYEDSVDEGETAGGEPIPSATTTTASPSTIRPSTTVAPVSMNMDQHNEQLVAKYLRPSGSIDRDNGSGDRLHSSSSSPQNIHYVDGNSTMNSNSNKQSSNNRLMSGALTKHPIDANMNDIVSNLIGSMNVSNSNSNESSNTSTTKSPLELEREEEDQAVDVASEGNNATTSTSGSLDNVNFERWLSRIQFQDPIAARKLRKTSAQNSATVSQHPSFGQNSTSFGNQSSLPAKWLQLIKPQGQNATTTSNTINQPGMWAQQDKQQQIRQAQSTTSPAVKGYQPMQQQTPQVPSRRNQMSIREAFRQNNDINRHHQQQHQQQQQNPYQQKLIRQQQNQLIHGIKYPVGQASTINVVAQDGASNTSLSFASMSSLTNEMGQMSLNSTNPSLEQSQVTSGNESGNLEQTAYQSQDEILRQVTSAINFEQQLTQKKMDEMKQQYLENKPTGNEQLERDNSNKLLKVGTSVNELTTDSNGEINNNTKNEKRQENRLTTQESSNLSQQGNRNISELLKAAGGSGSLSLNDFKSTNGLTLENIDKNFDLLADKLRQLAQQQKLIGSDNNTDSSQPSWLRAQNVANSIIDLSNQNRSSQQQQVNLNVHTSHLANNLDKIRELLNKHEQTKNELKSSQESMAQLMKQLMQQTGGSGSDQKSTGENGKSNTMASLLNNQGPQHVPDDLKQQQHQEQQVSNLGWTPVAKLPTGLQSIQQQAPVSPANLIKNRVQMKHQFPVMKTPPPHQLLGPNQNRLTLDELNGLYQDSTLNDELQMNDLAMMFASSQANQEGDPASAELTGELRPNQRIIGVPIAILKEDEIELSRAQLEAAAAAGVDQLSTGQKRHLIYNAANQNRFNNDGPQTNQQQHQHLEQRQHHPQQQQQSQVLFPHGPTARAPFVEQSMHQASVAPPQSIPQMSSSQLDSVQRQNLQNALNSLTLNQISSLLQGQSEFEQQQQQSQQPLRPGSSSTNSPIGQIESTANLAPDSGITEQSDNIRHYGGQNEQMKSSQSGDRQQHHHHQQHESSQMLKQEQQQQSLPNQQAGQQQHHQQQNQQQQQQSQSPLTHHQMVRPLNNIMDGNVYSNQYPRHPDVQLLDRPPLVTTTTITSGGPPVRLREMSLHKPPGFQSHHAITYQASPVVAAMFPGLVAGGPTPLRPSVLRHMSPFRSTFNEGGRLLSPLIPPQIADQLRHHLPPSFNRYNSIGPYAPLSGHPLMRPVPFYRQDQLRRQSSNQQKHNHQHPYHTTNSAGHGRQMRLSPQQVVPSQTRTKVRHMDPDSPIAQTGNIVEDANGVQHLEKIKFIPLDESFDDQSTSQIDDEEIRLVQRHINNLDHVPMSHTLLRQFSKQPQEQSKVGSRLRMQRGRFSDLESITEPMKRPVDFKANRSSCVNSTTGQPVSTTTSTTTMASTSRSQSTPESTSILPTVFFNSTTQSKSSPTNSLTMRPTIETLAANSTSGGGSGNDSSTEPPVTSSEASMFRYGRR